MRKRRYRFSAPIIFFCFLLMAGLPANVLGAIAPSAPTSLKALAINSTQINVTWSPVTGASDYYVFRAAASAGAYSKIATVVDHYYYNTGLSGNTTYYYKIQAVNSAGASDFSAETSATTKPLTTPGDAENTYRLAGTDRYATSAEIALDGWTTSDYAVLASGENFPDALCGSPLAGKYKAPILLTSRDQLNDKTRSVLTKLGVKEVFIIGGPNVVSDAVEQAIKDSGITVTRIAGNDRYATSLLVAMKLGTFEKAIVATGNNFPDALSIAAIAAMKGYPILLTNKEIIAPDILAYLKDRKAPVIVVGGSGVISDNVFTLLPTPLRLDGANRYDTNLSVIQYFADSLNFANCYIATGANYPDALSGSALAAKKAAPVFLTADSAGLSLLSYLQDRGVSSITVFGGITVIPSAVLNSLALAAAGMIIPVAPANITTQTLSPSAIFLDWSPVSNAEGYYLYRAVAASGPFTMINAGTSPNFSDSGLSANTTYYYKVKAYNSYGISADSPVADGMTEKGYVLTKPANLKAEAINSKEIYLSWDPVEGAESYYIYRAVSLTGTYTRIKMVLTEIYLDTGLYAERNYYYRVQASGSSGPSDLSDIFSAKTAAVGIPANVTAAALSTTEIRLTWDTVRDAESYSIYRADSADGTFTIIAASIGLEYTNTGLEAGRTYYYKIRTYNGSSFSGYSVTLNAATLSL